MLRRNRDAAAELSCEKHSRSGQAGSPRSGAWLRPGAQRSSPPGGGLPLQAEDRLPALAASMLYFSSTEAPASSSSAFSLSASSLLTPSLMAFGAPSTRSLASLRPRLVAARTTLITAIF